MLCRSLYDHTRLVKIPGDSRHTSRVKAGVSHMKSWWSFFFQYTVCMFKIYSKHINVHFTLVCTHMYTHSIYTYPISTPTPTFCHFVVRVFEASININTNRYVYIYIYTYWCFLKWWYPNLHPKMVLFSRKPNSCWVPPVYIYYICILANYSDLTRPHLKWWFGKGNPLISGKSGLVKYNNLTRNIYKYM